MSETKTSLKPIAIELTVTVTALAYPEPEWGGYSVEVPALPGCYTYGDTLDEVREQLRDAVEGWLAASHDVNLERSREEAAE